MLHICNPTHLSPSTGVLSNFQSALDTVSQEESTNVEEFSVVEVRLDFWLLEVVDGELFGGLKGSAQRSGRDT